MNQTENRMLALTYFACLWLGATLFVSFSAASLFHVFILISGSYFTYQAFKARTLRFQKSTIVLLIFALVAIISLIASGGPYKYALKLKYFLIGILSIPALTSMSEKYLNEKRVKILFTVFLAASAIASASGLIGLFSGFNPLRFKAACHPERACGMYGMYMSYGYGMGYFVLVSLLVLLNQKKYKSVTHPVLWWISNIVNFVGFYLSYARGALGAFVAGTVAYFLKKQLKWAVLIALGFVGIGITLFYTNESFHRMLTVRGPSNDARYSLYQASYYAFRESPILGLGYRNFEDQSVRIKKQNNILLEQDFAGTAHNNFLEALASTGLLGFLCMILFHFFWALEMWKRNDLIGQIGLAFISSLFVSGQVEYTLGDGETLFFIMFIYAWTQSLKKIDHEIS